MGTVLKECGYIKECIHCYVTAIRLNPLYATAHSNLGRYIVILNYYTHTYRKYTYIYYT